MKNSACAAALAHGKLGENLMRKCCYLSNMIFRLVSVYKKSKENKFLDTSSRSAAREQASMKGSETWYIEKLWDWKRSSYLLLICFVWFFLLFFIWQQNLNFQLLTRCSRSILNQDYIMNKFIYIWGKTLKSQAIYWRFFTPMQCLIFLKYWIMIVVGGR